MRLRLMGTPTSAFIPGHQHNRYTYTSSYGKGGDGDNPAEGAAAGLSESPIDAEEFTDDE